MASSSPSAGLVGNSFVGQYYNVLHQSPSVVYRFYTDESKLSRYDENGEVETVTTQQGINAKIMSMDFTSFKAEIKSVDSQNSLSGGVLVMVTGTLSCQSTGTRNFVQTFFLAPQEKGYFVLNDVFRYVEGGPAKSSPYSMANGVAESTVPSVPETDEQLTEEIEGEGEEELPEEHYDIIPEEAPVEEPEEELIEEPQLIDPPVVEAVPEEAPTPPTQSEEEHGEPAKKSYASIVSELRGAVFQPKPKPAKSTPEKLPAPAQTSSAPPASTETPEESTPSSDSEVGDKRTVYVKNLPMNVSDQAVEAEFRKFGTLRAGGVQVRTHKQQGGCYAFVEFEDSQSAADAVKTGTLEIEGRLAYIEEKKAAAPGARRFSSDRGGRSGGGGRGFYRDGGGRGGEFGGRGYEREGGPRGYERGGFVRRDEREGGGGGRPRRGAPSNEVDEGGFRRYDNQRSQRRGGNGNRNGRQE